MHFPRGCRSLSVRPFSTAGREGAHFVYASHFWMSDFGIPSNLATLRRPSSSDANILLSFSSEAEVYSPPSFALLVLDFFCFPAKSIKIGDASPPSVPLRLQMLQSPFAANDATEKRYQIRNVRAGGRRTVHSFPRGREVRQRHRRCREITAIGRSKLLSQIGSSNGLEILSLLSH